MGIGKVDLNLLKVFDAVFEERNLVLAGRRLHLSQSAVSHALSRLREMVGDELFVRTGRGMAPTGAALRIAPELRDALRRIEAALDMTPFSPSTSKRRFVIAANDHVTVVLMAPLASKLTRAAPDVDLVIRPSTRLDLAEQIDLGRIDLAVGIFSQVPPRFGTAALMSQGETLLMRREHPAARTELMLEAMTHYPLITISVGGDEEGAVGGFILERGLARQSEMFDRNAMSTSVSALGIQPRVRITVPHSLAIPALLRDSDMLSIVPASLARELARGDASLVIRPLPYLSGIVTTRSVWHSRHDHDAGHVWLRNLVVDVAHMAGTGQSTPADNAHDL